MIKVSTIEVDKLRVDMSHDSRTIPIENYRFRPGFRLLGIYLRSLGLELAVKIPKEKKNPCLLYGFFHTNIQ